MALLTIWLTKTEVNHLLSLVEENEREGSYWGVKEQYKDRTKRILRKLKEAQ